jgi:hypothetical protein
MEGTASYAPVIGDISASLPDHEFMLVDIGCAGGIDPVWRCFGARLRALAVDGNVAEIERLQRAETHPGIRYLAALANLPQDHPFARKKEGRGYWGRSPWERLSVARSTELMKSDPPRSTSEMVAANQWSEMAQSDEVIVVPAYLRDQGTTSLDFLKIDVDGADFDILNSFDGALDPLGVLGVGIEINYFGSASDTDHTFHNVDRFMKARGFELFGLTVRRYSVSSLPSRYVLKLPAASEFGRPLQGDALYVRDLASSDCDGVATRLSEAKLTNLICLFAAFNLPDCAAEVALRFRERLSSSCDVDHLLDLLAAQAQWPTDQPLSYLEYIRRFEAHDQMFFTSTAASDELNESQQDAHPATLDAASDVADHEVDAPCEQNQLRLERTRAEQERHDTAKQRSRELGDARRQLEEATNRIAAMESSKFWKLRRVWFQMKRSVGLGDNE